MNAVVQFVPLILLIVIMYLLLIRPQKKREKQVNEMRNSVQVGDEVITIGGICGKIVKTKDETLVIQVGADKVKFEIMRWAVSKVVESSARPKKEVVEEVEEEAPKKTMPKRMKKAESDEQASDEPAVEETEEAPEIVEAEIVETEETEK